MKIVKIKLDLHTVISITIWLLKFENHWLDSLQPKPLPITRIPYFANLITWWKWRMIQMWWTVLWWNYEWFVKQINHCKTHKLITTCLKWLNRATERKITIGTHLFSVKVNYLKGLTTNCYLFRSDLSMLFNLLFGCKLQKLNIPLKYMVKSNYIQALIIWFLNLLFPLIWNETINKYSTKVVYLQC